MMGIDDNPENIRLTENDDFSNDSDKLITETGVSFRDRVSNLDKKGSRISIYPTKPKGEFHKWRIIVSIFLLIILFGTPLVKFDNRPVFLFDILNRQFIVFGIPFWPQDFFVFALGFLAFVVFVVLFTAIYGRIFCGWICPQTIFMEMVFRKIEYWLEGDGSRQKKFNNSPMTTNKFFRKSLKHLIFFSLSFLIGNTLLAYIIGIDQLILLVTDNPSNHLGGLSAMIVFTGLFYFTFSWFREQACTYVCPYARLQSVLLDNNTIVVAYDNIRGEPREKISKKDDRTGKGDCIDCGNCVRVCPTGIDIRNGTQLECFNCTACIDSCDEVMVKIGRPKKLIKYASYNQINESKKFRFTPRIAIYSTILLMLIGVVSGLTSTRSDVSATILRAKGAIYQTTDDGYISNLFTAKIINKTYKQMELELKLEDLDGRIKLIGKEKLSLLPDKLTEATFFVEIPASEIKLSSNRIYIGVYVDGKRIEKVKTMFTGPDIKYDKKDDEEHEDKK